MPVACGMPTRGQSVVVVMVNRLTETGRKLAISRVPDKRGIEDNSKIIFLISQRKRML